MNTPTTATSAPWVGWFRPSRKAPWTAIVEADDETTAFNRLLDMARGGDFTGVFRKPLPLGMGMNGEVEWENQPGAIWRLVRAKSVSHREQRTSNRESPGFSRGECQRDRKTKIFDLEWEDSNQENALYCCALTDARAALGIEPPRKSLLLMFGDFLELARSRDAKGATE